MKKNASIDSFYSELLQHYEEIVVLQNALWLLRWDMDTFMPKRALGQKTKQLALLGDIIHKRQTHPDFGTLLEKIIEHKDYSNLKRDKQRNIFLLKRGFDRLTKVPPKLVQAFAKQQAITYEAWQVAKKKADFSYYQKEQEKLIEIVRERAHCLDEGKAVLDVLMDQHEPGLDLVTMERVFGELKRGLLPVVKACVSSPKQPNLTLIHRTCPIEIQRQIALDQVQVLGFTEGRVDTSVHPITYGYYDDVRLTTRYVLNDFTESFYSIMHEVGHALYDEHYPKKYKWQPIGGSCSGGMHEGMARFMENMVGRNSAFWEYYLPRLKKITGRIFKDVALEPFIHAVNHVTPSLTRVGADEVTYSLHLIFRMEIEKALFADEITVGELPIIWNQKIEDYFGLEVSNDAEGVLQDMHWPYGAFGYFPNFAFGNIYGGQLLSQLVKDLPDWKDNLREGKIESIVHWLDTNVYQWGNLLNPQELVQKVTGKTVSPKFFLDYIRKKYSQLYEF